MSDKDNSAEIDSNDPVLPWERDGYDYSGHIDALHDSKVNARLVADEDPFQRALPDLGASAVVFARKDGEIDHVSLDADAPDISAEDLQHIRQQHPHLR